MRVGRKKDRNSHRNKTDPYYNSREWKWKREVVWMECESLCQECKRNGRLTPLRRGFNEGHVDHIIPRKRGGSDDFDILQLLCKPCHDSKSSLEANSR